MHVSDATITFWKDYERTVAAFFAPIRKADGLSERSVSAGERRLGIALPLLLREIYLRVGKRADLRKYHRLLGPAELRVSANALLFFEESQQVVYWGIKLNDTV